MLSGIGLLCNPSSVRSAAACVGNTACACGVLQPGEERARALSSACRLLRTLVFDSVGYLRGCVCLECACVPGFSWRAGAYAGACDSER